MKQSELANLTGYTRHAICHILSGRRDASGKGAARLAQAVPGTIIMDWLFARTNFKRLARIVQATPYLQDFRLDAIQED